MLSPKLETKRIILRRYNESDIDAFCEVLHDDRLHKYIPFPDLTKDEELEYINKCMVACGSFEGKYFTRTSLKKKHTEK